MTIRWGFMGAGRIASDFATALITHPDAEIQAVSSSDFSRSQKFGEKFHVKKIYEKYEEVAADPDVDVIYINRTHNFHLKDAKIALNNGKAVLCEKPLTLNLKEAEEMIALAKEKKVFLMIALWTRFFPAIIRLIELVETGTLGDIVSVQSQFGFKGDESNQRMSKRELGGGSLLDVGIYNLYLSYLVYGKQYPTKIISNALLHETEKTDLQVNGILEFGGANKTANFVCSFLGDHTNAACVVGTKGSVEIKKPFHCPTTLHVNIYGQETKIEEFPLPDAVSFLNNKENKKDHSFNYPNSDGMYYQANHVIQCLKDKKEESELVTREDALTITKLLDEIRLSHGVVYPVDE